jgi:uncharacterized protein (DUF1810 family)
MSAGAIDLSRFVDAQAPVYATVVQELRDGSKRSHWMWFVFPQLKGLGVSTTARHFGLAGAEEAGAYLAHPLLGPRLVECTRIVLAVRGRSAHDIFGSPDDLKLRSCMTLFSSVVPEQEVFAEVLGLYFDGRPDPRTVALL